MERFKNYILRGGVAASVLASSHFLARPAVAYEATIPQIIMEEAQNTGLNPDKALRIAWCESRFDPNALGPRQSNGEHPAGLFQMLPSTFVRGLKEIGAEDLSVDPQIYDPRTNARVGTYLLATGHGYEWACK